jgi:hypothetical protein
MTSNERQRGLVGVPLVHFRSTGANVNLGKVMAEDKSTNSNQRTPAFLQTLKPLTTVLMEGCM